MDQKLLDFQQLAALYDKQYAPYEWKRDALGFDLLRLAPWLDRVRQTKNDIEFYEISAAYTASLNDAHTAFLLPSDFAADLGFDVDIYDGKALVEFIDSTTFRAFPFRIGDELISVDGKSVADWLKEFGKYVALANPRSTDRYAASLITFRRQLFYPRTSEVGNTATVVIRRRGAADPETYTMPWTKSGLPLTAEGPVPSPRLNSARKTAAAVVEDDSDNPDPFLTYLNPLRDLQNFRLPEPKSLVGWGSINPVFRLGFPSTFVQRLGRSSADFFFSGIYTVSGKRIGFLRIPSFTVSSQTAALRQLETEVTFMQANTDALVLDVMRNPGGSLCYTEELLRRVVPYRYRAIGAEIRATRDWLISIHQTIEDAESLGASQHTIDLFTAIETELEIAYKQNRGRTNAVPLCNPYFERDPVTTASGSLLAYSKPALLLTDEFSASAAEIFAAVFQDSQRGPLYGWRTTGAGGSVSGDMITGFYSESASTVTQSIAVRTEQKISPEYGITPYIENVGVVPDIKVDYMTEDNLLNSGKTFVDSFTAAVVSLIK